MFRWAERARAQALLVTPVAVNIVLARLLTPKEFGLLWLLARHSGEVLSRCDGLPRRAIQRPVLLLGNHQDHMYRQLK